MRDEGRIEIPSKRILRFRADGNERNEEELNVFPPPSSLRPHPYFTSGQSPSFSGRNAWSAGIVARTL